VRVNGLVSRRLPNTASVSFKDCLAPHLLAAVAGRIAASAVKHTQVAFIMCVAFRTHGDPLSFIWLCPV
jgi:hypothetical protein